MPLETGTLFQGLNAFSESQALRAPPKAQRASTEQLDYPRFFRFCFEKGGLQFGGELTEVFERETPCGRHLLHEVTRIRGFRRGNFPVGQDHGEVDPVQDRT